MCTRAASAHRLTFFVSFLSLLVPFSLTNHLIFKCELACISLHKMPNLNRSLSANHGHHGSQIPLPPNPPPNPLLPSTQSQSQSHQENRKENNNKKKKNKISETATRSSSLPLDYSWPKYLFIFQTISDASWKAPVKDWNVMRQVRNTRSTNVKLRSCLFHHYWFVTPRSILAP